MTMESKIVKVGDNGFIQYINHMGSDEHIYEVATDTVTDVTKRSDVKTLIRRMLRHEHSSSFEFGEIEIRAQTPFYIWRQMIRHRASPLMDDISMYDEPSVNELSGRYSKVLDIIECTPSTEWRIQSKSNRQGSEGFFDSDVNGASFTDTEQLLFHHIIQSYNFLLEKGVAKEQARRLWPMAGYTRGYMKMDLWNWLHFCKLRLANEAQKEMRDFANIIYYDIVKPLFPIISEAFEDYVIYGIRFSRQELRLMRLIIDKEFLDDNNIVNHIIPNKTEQNEFRNKISQIYSDKRYQE